MSTAPPNAAHRRDTSRDGFLNRLETFLLTRFPPRWFWTLAQRIEPVRKTLNGFLIDRAIGKTPPRPFPYSTAGDYTSWQSLRDRTWSARHLPPAEIPGGSLPPVEEVVDLFRRPEGGMRVDAKSTVLFAHFAQWFTDGFLRTDRHDTRKNRSNHDVDLTPLYGRTAAISEMIRSKESGKLRSQQLKGEEYPLFFLGEDGLTARPFRQFEGQPAFEEFRPFKQGDNIPVDRRGTLFAWGGGPRANNQIGYVMFNTLFLREHNRICDELARAHAGRQGWDDERLFQTARNILIVILIRIVIEEYINHIAPYHFQFGVDAPIRGNRDWYRENHMSVEFNLLYRWHPLIPDEFDLGDARVPLWDAMFNNQLVIDRGLGKLFDAASRQPAGEIGLFNIARPILEEPLRVPQKSIQVSRLVRLASYNDYREQFGFPRVTDFDQITGDPERQAALKRLYRTVDRIELYPGLFAEDVRPNAVVGAMIGRMVGVDAFSQALTNPLLNGNIFTAETFSKRGLEIIESTRTISDILDRNIPDPGAGYLASLTRTDWKRI